MALPDVLDASAWLTNEETGWLRAWQPVSTVELRRLLADRVAR